MSSNNPYTCHEYREEMVLLGLQRRLHAEDITAEERESLQLKIKELEASMGMT